MLCAFDLGLINGNLEDTTKAGACQGRGVARFLRWGGWRDVRDAPNGGGARKGARVRGRGAREDLAKAMLLGLRIVHWGFGCAFVPLRFYALKDSSCDSR